MTYLELRNNRKDIYLIKSIDDEGTLFLSFSKPLQKPEFNNYLAKCKNTPCKYYYKNADKLLVSAEAKISFIENEFHRERNKIVIEFELEPVIFSNPNYTKIVHKQTKHSNRIKIQGYDVQMPFKFYYQACTVDKRIIFGALGKKCLYWGY